jgi:5-methylthioadenosine/S-adenosylhomocysteine deaminase
LRLQRAGSWCSFSNSISISISYQPSAISTQHSALSMIKVYTARWVLPVTRPSLEHAAVAVEGGRIVFVGPANEAPDGERIDLGECAMMPGLVNTHSHLELTAMQGWLEDLPFRKWIIRLTKARQQVLDASRLLSSARLGIAEGLLAGITTYADTCESGVVHQALRDMGVRGLMYLEVFGPHTDQAASSLKTLGESLHALRMDDTSLVRSGISPHAPYSVSDALFAGAAELAQSEDLPIAVHAAESDAEQRLVTEAEGDFADALRARSIDVATRGTSTIELLDRTGVLRARPLLIHCVRANNDDVRRMSDNDCAVAHCPASNAKLGHGVANLSGFLDAGIRVGLGSDSVASNNRMDILDEARLALLFGRAVGRKWNAFPATLGIELATISGARALGLDSELGSLDVGKSADLAAFPLDGTHAPPVQDPESALLFATSGRGATLVTVAGNELVRNGQLLQDVTDDLRTVRQAAADLRRLGDM